jgi:hypothetical protein
MIAVAPFSPQPTNPKENQTREAVVNVPLK